MKLVFEHVRYTYYVVNLYDPKPIYKNEISI